MKQQVQQSQQKQCAALHTTTAAGNTGSAAHSAGVVARHWPPSAAQAAGTVARHWPPSAAQAGQPAAVATPAGRRKSQVHTLQSCTSIFTCLMTRPVPMCSYSHARHPMVHHWRICQQSWLHGIVPRACEVAGRGVDVPPAARSVRSVVGCPVVPCCDGVLQQAVNPHPGHLQWGRTGAGRGVSVRA